MSATRAVISGDAIAANVATLWMRAGSAMLCAVVKADGYGHGCVRAARAARRGGAEWLAVASVTEARAVVAAGIDGPLLILSEPSPSEIDTALGMGVHLVVFRAEMIDAVSSRAVALGVPTVGLHLKVDTGMRRVGCEPADALDLAERIAAAPGVELAGTMTHLARADEPDRPTTDEQLDRFDTVLAAVTAAGIDPGIRHAANSAGTIAFPRSHYDMVRAGISIYGIPPDPALAGQVPLEPALQWVAPVRFVKRVAAGERVSYGHRHTFSRDTTVATVAAGYADGVRRQLGVYGGEVLLRGRRCPIVGVVTMDQLVVDCGPEAEPGVDVAVGDEAVLLGRDGDETITADDWAAMVDTISYEIVCGLSSRVPRTDAQHGEDPA